MKVLSFKDELIPWILAGAKTATTRIGVRKFLPGERTQFAGSNRQPLGVLEITEFRHVGWEQLSDELAHDENLPSVAVLREELQAIYGPGIAHEPLTVLYFRVIEVFGKEPE